MVNPSPKNITEKMISIIQNVMTLYFFKRRANISKMLLPSHISIDKSETLYAIIAPI